MSRRVDVIDSKAPDFMQQPLKDVPVRFIKGVGPRRAHYLERLGIKTCEDMLYYFPWRYEDRTKLKKIRDLAFGSVETTVGRVVAAEVITTRARRMKIFELSVADDTGFLKCRWFNQAYLEKYFRKGQEVILCGMVKGRPYSRLNLAVPDAQSGPEMDNPEFELVDNEDKFVHTARIVPVYRATEGFSAKQVRALMFGTVRAYTPSVTDFMPGDILERNGLQPLTEAIRETHFPEAFSDMEALNRGQSPAQRRLIFDEFFLLELGLALMKKREKSERGIRFQGAGRSLERFMRGLPFELTGSQKRVFHQIRLDMTSDAPMNRLVHGDVGCGKTVVALMSMLIAVDSGYQACLMVPTEILAEQHYMTILGMVGSPGPSVALLTSGSGKTTIEEVSGGDAQIIVGTHALIQDRLQFRRLGLAVIDEQHRFGVVQRAILRKKGFNPDILVMTATPIPRTLAMTLYGDLDISLIDELPSGRKPVLTKVFFPEQKGDVYAVMNEELFKGRQVYVVYPLIEGSEKMDLKCAVEGAEALKKKFPDNTVALIHGKIRREEREAIMASFKSGKIDILVATTVIEVGVDVPNATLMLIVHAERFGLAQLHQLRGRIGRGAHESRCLLFAYPPFSDEARRRLKAMEAITDGFRIAEEDLAIRGPGEFFGTRQSGVPELKVSNILRDITILEASRREAFAFADAHPLLEGYPLLRDVLHRRWAGKLELVKS